jgi:GMP synthase (glutamine-hydrolysing)
MNADGRPTLLAIQHVPWETPHRILDACGSLAVQTAKPLTGQVLPDHGGVAGAVVMGGPMGVDETDRHPELAAEREWLAEAVRREMPVLGICLGAQLLARALGAEVRPGEVPEIGWAPVEILDPRDPILGARALGDNGAAALPVASEAAERESIARTTPGLHAFAALAEANRSCA